MSYRRDTGRGHRTRTRGRGLDRSRPEGESAPASQRNGSADPLIARTFAEATLFSDSRDRLALARHPATLLQSRDDSLAPVAVGQYMEAHMPGSELRIIEGRGHCLHMTHSEVVTAEIRRSTHPVAS